LPDKRVIPINIGPNLVAIGDHVAIDHFWSSLLRSKLVVIFILPQFCSIIGGAQGKLVMKDFSVLSAYCMIVCGSDGYKGVGLTNPPVPVMYRKVTYSTVIL
jgi:hypothetical protein